MNYQADARHQLPEADPNVHAESQEPGLVDAVRFLYRRRVNLAIHSLVIFVVGALIFSLFYFASPKIVAGIVGLTFRGIEKGEYPSGRRFNVEDFRSPALLTKALADAGISEQRISLRDLAARIYVTPVVPAEIQNRWKKQEQAGSKKEEFSPGEFKIGIEMNGLTDLERIRLFDAVINRYQESMKFDQKSAQGFVSTVEGGYEKLISIYDPWDIPDLFRQTFISLHLKLDDLIAESLQYQDSSYQLSFREIAKDLDTWERTRLQALEALTYQGRLTRNREIVAQRIQYRIQDLDIQIKQKSQESTEAVRLLEVIDRPQALLAGQLSNKEGLPLIDAGVLDRLIKSDYVGPVVQRVSRLQEQVQTMQAEKARLEKQLSWLPRFSDAGTVAIPPIYGDLTNTLSRELAAIIQEYDGLLDKYLTATVTSMVVVKQSPLVSRSGYSPILFLPGIAILSVFLAVALLSIERLFERTGRGGV